MSLVSSYSLEEKNPPFFIHSGFSPASNVPSLLDNHKSCACLHHLKCSKKPALEYTSSRGASQNLFSRASWQPAHDTPYSIRPLSLSKYGRAHDAIKLNLAIGPSLDLDTKVCCVSSHVSKLRPLVE